MHTQWLFLLVLLRIWDRITAKRTRPYKVCRIDSRIHSNALMLRLAGQSLYTRGDKASLAVMDKQIYRLIGKAITLAAYVSCPLSCMLAY